MSLRRNLALLPVFLSAVALVGCGPPQRDEACDGALRACRAYLATAERTGQSCGATLESTRSDLASTRTENSQLQRRFHDVQRRFQNAKRESRRLERDLIEVQETNQKLKAFFKKLDEEIEHHSLLFQSPEQLRMMEMQNTEKLKYYREAARNLKERQEGGSSILSRLLSTDDDAIDWDPDYLQKRIIEVEAQIRRIRYSHILIARGATRLEELLGKQGGDGRSSSLLLLDGVSPVRAWWRQSVAEMVDERDDTGPVECDTPFNNVAAARG